MEVDDAFAGFHLGAVRYPTPALSQASNIEQIADRVLQDLDDHGVFKRYREIYLLGHSMGGLILKRVLIRLNRPTAAFVEKLRRVKAAIFISTPAQGSELAQLAYWISMNPQLRDLAPADLNTYLQSLENSWLDLIKDRDVEPWPQSYCAYETLPTRGIIIVDKVYSSTFCDKTPYAVDENHETIVKPTDLSAAIHVWTRSRIREAGALKPAGGYIDLIANRIDRKLLRQKYPFGFIVYFSDGRSHGQLNNPRYLTDLKIDVIMRPAALSLLELTSTTATFAVPDITVALRSSFSAYGNSYTISRTVGTVQNFGVIDDEVAVTFEVLASEGDMFVWLVGFRPVGPQGRPR